MKFEEQRWFDILFDNENVIEQKIYDRGNMHHEILYKNGTKVAELIIDSTGTKYMYY